MQALLRGELLQHRRSSFFHRWEQVLVVALAALLIFPALYALITMPTAPAFFDDPVHTLFWAQLAVWIVHIAVIVRCISFGVYTMSHEFERQTWESLILTGIPIPRIIIGKWRAALRRSAGYMVALGLVRLLILPITMVANVVPLSSDALRYAYCALLDPPSCPGVQLEGMHVLFDYADPAWKPATLVLAPIVAVGLTILEVLGATLLGIAVAALIRRTTFALAAALILRFALPVGILMTIVSRPFGIINSIFYMHNPSSSFALVDAGTAATIRLLVSPRIIWERLDRNWLDLGLASGLLLGLVVVSLVGGWWALRRQGVS